MVYTGYENYALGMTMPMMGPVNFMVEEQEHQLELELEQEQEQQLELEQQLQLKHKFSVVRNLLDEDLLLKHPLEHVWTVWHWENDRTKAWSDMLNEVTSFNTVEDFFSVYYFIKPPSDLRVFNDYMVFKQGVLPMWEDDVNKNGGRWMIMLDKSMKAMSDKLWHDLILLCIGECFLHSDEISGIVINVRHKANKLSLWTKSANNTATVMSLGMQLKSMLGLNTVGIQYQLHKDAMVQTGPNVKTIYKL